MTGQIIRMPDIRQVDPTDAAAKLRQDLLFAFHVVDMLGQPSGMGSHLTARLPGADTFMFHVHNFGFGDKNASLTLYSNKKGSGIASLYKRRLDHFNIDMDVKEEIDIKTIDAFCNEINITNINFLKLDIEGNELKALHGAKTMLENHKVDFIQFEFGGCNIDSRTYFQDFYYLLKEDFYIYRIVKDGLFKIESYKEMYEAFITTNYLAERKKII